MPDKTIDELREIAARWSEERAGERVTVSEVVRVLLARAIAAEQRT